MKLKSNYFEVGRGAKLIPNEYWHQYVLGVDILNIERPFVVSEIGRTEALYTQDIGIVELISGKWDELIKISDSLELIEILKTQIESDFKLPEVFTSIIKKQSELAKLIEGNWISTEVIEVLDYNSNFGNWVDTSGIPGYFRFLLDFKSQETKNCHLQIPVNYWSLGNGYYSIYYGAFQFTFNQLLIWQIDTFPVMIKFSLTDEILTLDLFGKKISFRKE